MKKILIMIALLTSLTLGVAACGKGSDSGSNSGDESAKTPLIDPRGDSARESINKYIGTALHVKDSASKQVEASKERQRMMESLGDE
jgi:hypothetical protein